MVSPFANSSNRRSKLILIWRRWRSNSALCAINRRPRLIGLHAHPPVGPPVRYGRNARTLPEYHRYRMADKPVHGLQRWPPPGTSLSVHCQAHASREKPDPTLPLALRPCRHPYPLFPCPFSLPCRRITATVTHPRASARMIISKEYAPIAICGLEHSAARVSSRCGTFVSTPEPAPWP